MRYLISILLLGSVVVPLAIALVMMLKHELETKEKTTGGHGLPVLVSALVVFVVMPVLVFFTSP